MTGYGQLSRGQWPVGQWSVVSGSFVSGQESGGIGRQSSLSPKGTKLVAGGNAPGKRSFNSPTL